VFSFATLEHVHNIEAAYSEMVRVLNPGGTVYCHASPLWNSRSGPHWGDAFSCVPWAHLKLGKKEIHKINEILQRYSAEELDYFLDERFFNQRPARDYLAAGWRLPEVEVLRNNIDLEDDTGVPSGLIRDLNKLGYSRLEIFGLSHTLVVRKLK
jgi:ubiquinone/menaquinone biosynthesis C-methylase UbiE